MEQPTTPDTATIKVPKRAYQACIRCRRRKARCIVSESTSGGNPVCLKCKRERKVCIFTAERSRKQQERLSQQSLQAGDTSQNRTQTHHIGGNTSTSPLWNHHLPATPHQENRAGQGVPITSPMQDDSPLSDLTDRVTRTTVSNQAEAINLLFEAAEVYHTKVAPTGPGIDVGEPSNVDSDSHSIQASSLNSLRHTEGWLYPAENAAVPSEESYQTFSKLKFVRKRWLTAQEAITYVELFYKNMKPLSPIVDDHYGHPHNFHALVNEEPVLCTTILTLSSRYHLLHGDGWLSRSYFLHNRLWRYCHSLLQRVIWGQEKCVVSSARSLGTVEGLLLMAEWHARSLHLPPDTEAWDSEDDNPKRDEANASAHIPNRWLEGVVEPMRRSDRMSWALIQSAASLAQELEIFDKTKDETDFHVPDAAKIVTKRRQRLRVLLYVYINQLAFRIGYSSLIPHNLVNVSPNEFKRTSIGESTCTDQWVNLMSLWVDLTGLVRISHDLLFSSKAVTRDLVLSGGYRRILNHFKPMLENWWEKYTALDVHGPLPDLLCIDFLYTRIYIYSLALQAAAERKMTHQSSDAVPPGDLPSILDYPYEDYGFVQDVVGGAKEVLRIVLVFAEAGRLRYLPVRTYVRVISTCIFLLKALALGVPADQLNTSLGLIDQSARVLRLHTVDDLHLAGIFASLLETYTQGFRARFVSILKVPRSSVALEEMGPPLGGTNVDEGLGNDIATGTINEYEINHDWFAHPFDSSIAPFGVGFTQPFGVFDDDLNFIWNESV